MKYMALILLALLMFSCDAVMFPSEDSYKYDKNQDSDTTTDPDKDSVDPIDKDVADPDSDPISTPVCGNSKLETGETCETGETMDCTLINGDYTSGTATCKSDCLSWVKTSCVAKPVCDGNFPNQHDGLCWSDKSANTMNWETAKTYCSELGGKFPTIDELRTLIINCPGSMTGGACKVSDPDNLASGDYNSGDCMCDGNAESYSALGDDKNTKLCSSSELLDTAWGVSFYSGHLSRYNKTNDYNVRCVR